MARKFLKLVQKHGMATPLYALALQHSALNQIKKTFESDT